MAAPQRLRRTALVARPSTAALSLTPTRARSSHATHASPIRHHAAHDALDARARKAAQGLVAGGSASGVAGGVAGSAANGRGKGTTVADAQLSFPGDLLNRTWLLHQCTPLFGLRADGPSLHRHARALAAHLATEHRGGASGAG
eukprot:Opistho-2@5731